MENGEADGVKVRTTTIGVQEILGDLNAPAGSRLWAIGMKNRLQELLDQHKGAREHLELCVEAFTHYEGWKHFTDRHRKPLTSWEEFCLTPRGVGLGCRPSDIEAILAGPRLRSWQVREAPQAARAVIARHGKDFARAMLAALREQLGEDAP